MELLAPVGNQENFQAALDAGADAVYVGAPGLNARNLARDLRLEEIGAMIRVCRDQGKRLYVAANSLVLETELPEVIETLALLETLEPDALIVQDLGLINLIRAYFPRFPLHASTLMLAHTADAVHMLSALGCRRVVLARELSLKEIAAIAGQTDVQLEVFVHGAMCFSYSGLCLFSSYLGGKSGLRGRCVQPCRRRYQWQGKGGKGGGKAKGGSYLFSMNDLSGLEAIPELRRLGVASLKIEGRLRSAHYVSHVVQAYRLMLDSDAGDFDRALEQAKTLVGKAMGRTTAPGFFFTPRPADVITPYHSGNTGQHLGRMKTVTGSAKALYGEIGLKEQVAVGDRLRLHFESSGERLAFRLQEIRLADKAVDSADAGVFVRLGLPGNTLSLGSGRIELYKVDARTEAPIAADLQVGTVKRQLEHNRKRLLRSIRALQARFELPTGGEGRNTEPDLPRERAKRGGIPKKGADLRFPVELWLKTDAPKIALGRLPFAWNRLLLPLDKTMVAQAGRIRQVLGRRAMDVIWALPPVLIGAELGRTRAVIASLIRSGFKSYQIGHLSQIALFGKERVHLFGDYTLNLMNDQAVRLVGRLGLEATQVAIELDRNCLQDLFLGYGKGQALSGGKGHDPGGGIRLGLTVYGAPALFTARTVANHFHYDRALVSPRGEPFTIRRGACGTQTFSCRPFSLLSHGRELKEMGLGYAVVDITGFTLDRKGLQELADRVAGSKRAGRLSTFNYLGKLE